MLQFRDVCLRATATAGALAEGTLRELGALMDASHDSAAVLCENSCAEVDALVRAAKDAGAYGSRVTGAGWGGCTVSLVAEDAVPAFIAHMREAYPPYRGLDDGALSQVIFATKPSRGACGECAPCCVGVFECALMGCVCSVETRVKRARNSEEANIMLYDSTIDESIRNIFSQQVYDDSCRYSQHDGSSR